MLKPAIVIATLAVVFGWLLPQFIDYAEVWDALTELDAEEVLVLLGLGLARIPSEAVMYRAFLPGLGLWRGTEAYLSSNLAGQVLPPPPRASSSTAISGAADSRRRPPGSPRSARSCSQRSADSFCGFRPRAVAHHGGGQRLGPACRRSIARDHGAAGIAGYIFLRDERSAPWLGAGLQRPLSWILVAFKRDPIGDGAARAAQLRTRTLAVLREGWAVGSIGVAANLLLTYLILLAALRFVGVSGSELPAVDAFAAFAIAF